MNTATISAQDRDLSDTHKSAYGFRPSPNQWALWNTMNDAQLDAEEAYLQAASVAAAAEEAEQEVYAGIKFEKFIAKLMADHNIDRATAIRWDMDAYGDEVKVYGMEMYCYEHGLAYGYFNTAERIQ